MTDAEIERRAKEYEETECYQEVEFGDGYAQMPIKSFAEAFIDGAKSREEEISELKDELRKLKKQTWQYLRK